MNRRLFLKSIGSIAGVVVGQRALADGAQCSQPVAQVRGLSEGFFAIRHRHEFIIPLEILKNPPESGYSARTSTPLVGETDFDGLRHRHDSNGNPLDLTAHTHAITLSQAELAKLAAGMFVNIALTQFGHQFYFVADDFTLAALKS